MDDLMMALIVAVCGSLAFLAAGAPGFVLDYKERKMNAK